MTSGGFIAALRTVPVGDKVALGGVASRDLFASLTPRKVFGGEDARRRLVRRAFLQTCAVQRLLLVLPEQPGRHVCQGLIVLYWRSLLSKDRQNCHLGGDAFVSCNGFEPITLCNLRSQSNEVFIFSAWFFFLSFAYWGALQANPHSYVVLPRALFARSGRVGACHAFRRRRNVMALELITG